MSANNDTKSMLSFSGAAVAVLLSLALAARFMSEADDSLEPRGEPQASGDQAAASSLTTTPHATYTSTPLNFYPLPPARNPPRKEHYPADLTLEAEDLKEGEVAGRVRILDARSLSEYEFRHIPGAVWVNYPAWSEAFRNRRLMEVWQKGMGELGIDVGTPVVIYDGGFGFEAACLRLMLRYWGVEDVRLINGGWPAWQFAAGPQVSAPTHILAGPIRLTPQPQCLIGIGQLKASLQDHREQVIDVHYADIRENIPNAKYLDCAQMTRWRDGRFKSSGELAAVFAAAGIDINLPTVVYCPAPERAALAGFVLELVGAKKVRVYDAQ
jgi:thiosulfate/3-mercaptopyruvate sulfurtransferase